ncbi:MAG: polyamine aminopropyltransferase [Chitinispirillales bacterium]|jgi:spermidine synthase|nr:polyamine aminopropyltransferase [Chitinispirillales bacterium]
MAGKTKKRIFHESLNPDFGYYYTINKTLKKATTKYQKIELVDSNEFGRVLMLDGITQTADKNDYMYHEPMVHPAMCAHPKPRSVLVVGGGDGGIIREILKYPSVKRIELAELDAGVVRFSKKYLKNVHGGCFDDPRVNVNIVDGRKFTSDHPGEFDVVIMDMTDPLGPSKMLYTKEFYRLTKRAMRDRSGIFVMHTESPIARPKAFSCILKTLGSVYKNVNSLYMYVQMYSVLWSIAVVSDEIDLAAARPAAVDKKLARLGIGGLKMYNGATHASMLTPYPYITEILSKRARVITDARPDFPDGFLN